MSRHKNIRSLDLEDELDVFDGDPELDFKNELNPEDEGTLRDLLNIKERSMTCITQSSSVRALWKFEGFLGQASR